MSSLWTLKSSWNAPGWLCSAGVVSLRRKDDTLSEKGDPGVQGEFLIERRDDEGRIQRGVCFSAPIPQLSIMVGGPRVTVVLARNEDIDVIDWYQEAQDQHDMFHQHIRCEDKAGCLFLSEDGTVLLASIMKSPWSILLWKRAMTSIEQGLSDGTQADFMLARRLCNLPSISVCLEMDTECGVFAGCVNGSIVNWVVDLHRDPHHHFEDVRLQQPSTVVKLATKSINALVRVSNTLVVFGSENCICAAAAAQGSQWCCTSRVEVEGDILCFTPLQSSALPLPYRFMCCTRRDRLVCCKITWFGGLRYEISKEYEMGHPFVEFVKQLGPNVLLSSSRATCRVWERVWLRKKDFQANGVCKDRDEPVNITTKVGASPVVVRGDVASDIQWKDPKGDQSELSCYLDTIRSACFGESRHNLSTERSMDVTLNRDFTDRYQEKESTLGTSGERWIYSASEWQDSEPAIAQPPWVCRHEIESHTLDTSNSSWLSGPDLAAFAAPKDEQRQDVVWSSEAYKDLLSRSDTMLL